MAAPSWVIGVDIGGTFTDLVAIEERTGERVTGKVLTTPADPLVGVFDGLAAVAARGGFSLPATTYLVHGTTLAINTLIERKGARVGLITTKGFRDVIEAGNANRYDIYDLQLDAQPPLVRRERRLGVVERINARGEVIRPLDPASLDAAIEQLRHQQVEAVAICFLNAYASNVHELPAAEAVGRALPNVYVSMSSDVAPIIREYERFLATAINAYVGPKVATYLGQLTEALAAKAFAGFVGIMKSDGGMSTPDEASRYAVQILESGPAAGVLSAAHTAVQCGQHLAVAFDMGGTTAKACLVVDGEPSITDELEVSRLRRFKKGSGLPLRLPSIDLIEVGAGGGSIASIDSLGLLQVGPESSGADPGPACYGRGGEQPTVTDADLLLGYLNADYFAAGAIPLDREAARRAVATLVEPTGAADVTQAAWEIHDLVNENMARAVRLHSVEHGVDPERISLVATGGAGPVHASNLMSKLGAQRVICPTDAGVASALGLLLAPRKVERTVTELALLEEVGAAGIQERLARLAATVKESVPPVLGQPSVLTFLHLRLRGQAYDLRIRVPEPLTEERLKATFADEYTKRFGRAPGDGKIEIVNWTVRLVEERPVSTHVPRRAAARRPGGTRQAYFGPRYGWREAKVFDRGSLPAGFREVGPMLVEEEASTVVVGPDQLAFLDGESNLYTEPIE